MDAQTSDKLRKELENAYRSQAAGKDGRARVCARRAAGWAIQAYLAKHDVSLDDDNALNHIKYFSNAEGLSEKMQAVLHHLHIKLEKDSLDEDAYYPIEGVDLVQEAHWLVETLLGVDLNVARKA